MAYDAIFQNIMTLLQADAQLIPGLLGPKTVQNMRLYRAWPQMQSFLTTYEPTQPAEGWLVVEEPAPGLRASMGQYTSDHEFLEILFHVYATKFSLTHAVIDVLDTYFHWLVEQEVDVQWGNRVLFFTRRYQDVDKYQADIKLFEKQVSYRMEFVRDEDPVLG